MRIVWFGLGFLAAVALVAALVLGPLMDLRASGPMLRANVPALRPRPSPTPLRLMPSPPPTVAPTPTAPPTGLTWWREGGVSGRCEYLEINALNQIYHAPCDQGPRLTYLTRNELDAYLTYLDRYAPFDYAIQDTADRLAGATLRLHFAGEGQQVADEDQQGEILTWARDVYERVAEEEVRADTVAAARLELARRLNTTIDAMITVSVEQVTWPDACLGIPAEGLFCAQVQTPGYRILLQREGDVFEYRADRHGLVRPFETD